MTWLAFKNTQLSRERLAAALAALFAMSVIFVSFTEMKKGIPYLNWYRWDPYLAGADEALHFGKHPWLRLHYVLDNPNLTAALDELYFMWIPVLVLCLAWQAWSGRARLRLQFFISVAGVWVLVGSFLATVFSSAGPCYYHLLVPGPDPYAALMQYLREVDAIRPLGAVASQRALWYRLLMEDPAIYSGISAMPSVHVSMATLFVFLGYATSPWLGRGALVFLVAILAASVHLGWHYALDGYVAIAAAAAIWHASGWLTLAAGVDGADDSTQLPETHRPDLAHQHP